MYLDIYHLSMYVSILFLLFSILFYLMGVCVIHVFVCVYMNMLSCECSYGDQRLTSGIFLYHRLQDICSLILTEFLTEPGTPYLDPLLGQWAHRMLQSLPTPPALKLSPCLHFIWMTGTKNHVLMLAQQAHYLLSHLTNPQCRFSLGICYSSIKLYSSFILGKYWI